MALLQTGMRSPDSPFLSDCLATTAFTKYGRCFKGGLRIKTTKELLAQLTPEDLKTHDLIIDIRDKHVSHSVSELERPDALIGLVGDSPERRITGVSIGLTSTIAPDLFVFHNWLVLLNRELDWLHSESLKESERLTEIAKQQFTLDELYAKVGEVKKHQVKFKNIAKNRKGT